MKRILLPVLLLLVFSLVSLAQSQDTEPVPTLVPPTPIPTLPASDQDVLRAESVVARLQQSGVVRVGILYNEPPFGNLSIRGELVGFDADLARAMAEAWEVEIEFVQVMRQNALDMLQADRVDMLIAAQIHRRELGQVVEFSQTYAVGAQVMMVRADDNADSLVDLVNREVGYVMATDADAALNAWIAETSAPVIPESYLTLDQAVTALALGDVDGVVASRHRLLRVLSHPEEFRFLDDDPVMIEPYAVVMPYQDAHLRNLVNRTLQYLLETGQLEEMHNQHFPGAPFPFDVLAVWNGLGEDAPKPSQFGTDMPYPGEYVTTRLFSGGSLRVAGLGNEPQGAPESVSRLYTLNRSLIDQMAARWGVTVEYLPAGGNPFDLVASGQADIAVNIEPDWDQAGRVDFTSPYLLHGDRLMVPANGDYQSFNDLRGRWVAIMGEDEGAAERAQEWADSINARINLYTTNERDVVDAILENNNANVAYGDSLRLIPHVQANPGQFELTLAPDDTPRWYSRNYKAFAVPFNDTQFRLLVEYTLQEFIQDGTLETLLRPVMMPGELPAFDIWPGSGDIFRLLGLS